MFAYVGGYTSEDRQGRGLGITVFQCGRLEEPWSFLQTFQTEDNPSMLRVAPGGNLLYAAHGARPWISAYRIDGVTGCLTPHGREECGGLNPVDLAFTHDGRFLITAHYTSGTVSVLPIAPGGALSPPHQVIALRRPGLSSASLPHGVTIDPSGQFVVIPDKGLDCVFVFRIGPDGRLLAAPSPYAAAAAGAGPRHAVFHPHLPLLYVVNELGCSVQVFGWDENTGTLAPLQVIPVALDLPASMSACAEVSVSANGLSVYASTRGDNSMTVFNADGKTGLLSAPRRVLCGGKEPRFFTLTPDDRGILVANQESDTILAYTLDPAGMLQGGTVVAHVGSPSSICFASPP